MTYTEILNFYYPGMTLEVIEWPEVELTALEELPESIGFARGASHPHSHARAPAGAGGRRVLCGRHAGKPFLKPERARGTFHQRAHCVGAWVRPARHRILGCGRRAGCAYAPPKWKVTCG